MNFNEGLNLLESCFIKFKDYFNDCNYNIVTHDGVKVAFNIRQSKLAIFLGLGEKYLRHFELERTRDYKALINLVENKDYFVNLFNNGGIKFSEVFDVDAERRMKSFLNLKNINAENAKFVVFCDNEEDYDCYIFVNGTRSYKEGSFIALNKQERFYVPKDIITVKNLEQFNEIINKGNVSIVSTVNFWDKKEDKNLNTKRDANGIMSVAEMLTYYGLSGFDFSKEEIKEIMFDTQFENTKIINPSIFGYNDVGKIKTNKAGLTILELQLEELRKLKDEITKLQEENERLQEISYNALEELYYNSINQNESIEKKGNLLQLIKSFRNRTK